MTLRIDDELLDQLRTAAAAEHQSVSRHVLALVRRDLELKPRRRRGRPLPTLGWLKHLDAPDSLEEFRRLRRALRRRLMARARRDAKAQ